jgi:hypothetical protein
MYQDLQRDASFLRNISARNRAWVIRAALVVFFLFEIQPDSKSAVLETKGRIAIRRYSHLGNELKQFSFESPVAITLSDSGPFTIKIDKHPAIQSAITFSYDGTNYFYVFLPRTNPRSESQQQNTVSNQMAAYLSTGEMPLILFEDAARDALWYALGSGVFFSRKGSTGEMIHLFFGPRMDINAYGFRYEVKLTNSTFALPYELRLWKDSSLDKASASAEGERIELDLAKPGSAMRESQWQLKKSWKNGNRAIDLVWKQQQRLEDLVLPQEIEINDYHPYPHSAPVRLKINIELQSWQRENGVERAFQPPIDQPMKVIDSRLRARDETHSVDSVLYEIGRTNFHWYSTNDSYLKAMSSGIMMASSRPTSNRGMLTRVVLMIVLLGLLVLPTVGLFRKRTGGMSPTHVHALPAVAEGKMKATKTK